jgi:LEA14-like dessication related protein
VGKPEIREISYSWGKVTEDTTEILVKIKVYNPNPFPIPLKDVEMDVYMNGIKMGEGHAIKAGIEAKSESTIVIAIDLDNNKIPEWWVSHIRNGEKTMVDIKGNLVFDLKVFDFKYPIEFSNPIETDILSTLSTDKPKTISIDSTEITIRSISTHWGNVDSRYTEIITIADIYNGNPYPIPVTKFSYLIKMNGIKVGEGGEDLNAIIQPKSDAKITLITKIENDKLKEWWVSHIRNGERTEVEVLLKPIVEIAGKKIEFTLTKQTFEFKTGFLS